jgi:tRNA threonylcarbamoyl adenosine modification protein (Sua5/YciO/YrdC/YwlC family)
MSTALIYKVHADHPEASKIARMADAVAAGAVVAYPTDTVYAIGCDPRSKTAVDRLRQIKPALRNGKRLTLLCPSLQGIARYAYVEDAAYRLIKALTPGPYTFILRATKEVPLLVMNPKRKMVGLRIPANPFCQALLARLGGLLVTTSAKLDSGDDPESREELFDALIGQVDLLVDDGGPLSMTPSTMIDVTTTDHVIVREGMGMDALGAYLR